MSTTRLLRLDGAASSYVVDATGEGMPVCRYWGRRLPDGLDLALLADLQERPLPLASLDQDAPLSLMPEFGFGWFGAPGLAGHRQRRDWHSVFRLDSVKELETGYRLCCRDEAAGLELELDLTLDPATDVLARRSLLRNAGTGPYHLEWCAAAAFALPPHCVELLSHEGQWSQEFQERRQRLGVGTWSRENRRGRTSHDAFPQLVVGSPDFGEESGEVYGFHMAWSGNHRLLVETSNEGSRQVQLGEWLAPGEMVLEPGEAYESPAVHAAWSGEGLNGLSQRFHRFVRSQVLRWPGGSMRPRPVHINTWEAMYFKHRLEDLKDLARAGAEVGVERFVLDDGWFPGRDDDRAGLGDWVPDPTKYPEGLGPLVDCVRELGMEFGLWVEPEMVNPDSELYRKHPDWALQLAGRPLITGRNQLVLDLANPAVSGYLFEAIGTLLSAHPIAYLKWDMNRDLLAGSGQASEGVATYRRQTLALYALLERFRQAYPEVEIESCASGAGRADHGILAHTHRIWTSDNNDALERQRIQRGFSRFFPPELMGAHIGPSPGHICYRQHTLAFRAATALFGHLGLELDVRGLSSEERAELRAWIDVYKHFRGLLHGGGRTWRLDTVPDAGSAAHGVVSTDGAEALYAIVQLEACHLRVLPPVRLAGLDREASYRLALPGPPPPHVSFRTPALRALRDGKLTVPGAILADIGLQLPLLPPETVLLLHLQRT